jgi:hypothetical protein
MSLCTIVRFGLELICSKFFSRPVEQLSITTTWCFFSKSNSVRWLPIKPAPPVTIDFMGKNLSNTQRYSYINEGVGYPTYSCIFCSNSSSGSLQKTSTCHSGHVSGFLGRLPRFEAKSTSDLQGIQRPH